MPALYPERLAALIARLAGTDHYRRISASHHEADVSGHCMMPQTREYWTRTDRAKRSRGSPTVVGVGHESYMWLIMRVPCRKCDRCRQRRKTMWQRRAVKEYQSSERTWFGTLTASAQWHALVAARCRIRCGTDHPFDERPWSEQLAMRNRYLGYEVTTYLKRIREASGAPIRFLAVMEPHKSMVPHYHLLLHELSPEFPLRKVLLDAQWHIGFSQWRLVRDPAQCAYVAKYLGKTTASRVRASLSYGVQCETQTDVMGEQRHPRITFRKEKTSNDLQLPTNPQIGTELEQQLQRGE